jgi:hypothetical protein
MTDTNLEQELFQAVATLGLPPLVGLQQSILTSDPWKIWPETITLIPICVTCGWFPQTIYIRTDETALTILQQGVDYLFPYLCSTFRVCMEHGFTRFAWRKVRAIFIPKPTNTEYNEAKAHCPVSLLFFLLKTMEKLVDGHIYL